MQQLTFILVLFTLFQINANLDLSANKNKFRESLPLVDISFVIVDLKYNDKDGVKICEMQPASYSQFIGYDYLMGGDALVPILFCNEISKYQNNFWFMGVGLCDKKFVNQFRQRGWKEIFIFKELENDPNFITACSLPLKDPFSIHDYQGILYVPATKLPQLEKFRRRYPKIIILDSALSPHFKDKCSMNKLLESSPKLASLRPASMLCQKEFSKELVIDILNEITSEILVIKPIGASEGKGIIIVKKEDLEATLEYILNKENKMGLRRSLDRSYNHWGFDRDQYFLVEEFIESNAIKVPQFDNNLYDGTMRVVLLLIYDQKKLKIILLEGHWKLPRNSLSDIGTLNEKHKSYAKTPHFSHVEPYILEIVLQQLSDGFNELYQIEY